MQTPASRANAATSVCDASPKCLFPDLKEQAIAPSGDGQNLWQAHEFTNERWINLCGLWVGNSSELFDWCPLHQCVGRTIVAEYLRHTKSRISDKSGFGDLATFLRGAAGELAYDSKFDLFRLSGGALDYASIEIHPSLLYRDDVPAGEETLASWVIVGAGPSFEAWKSRTSVFWEEQNLIATLWTAAREGWIELTGRWPNAVSERRPLAPDLFYSDGRFLSGTTQLQIGDSTVWATEMRVSPSLAIEGMRENGIRTTSKGNSRPAISDETLRKWLEGFLERNEMKATRAEAVSALKESYTSTSVRESYSRQTDNLKRDVGEKK